ncbi:hypothetical protein C4J81_04970 [Deltaproteobacteria bacterium Smac51]|nr:hypothetical protein C4J81_04970 [Deltaproteobacteria bacterium Smac51]
MSINNYNPADENQENAIFNEMSNFIDVNATYNDFITGEVTVDNGEFFPGREPIVDFGERWFIQSCGEVGLNVFYHIYIVRPRGREFQVTLPWLVQEACPHCQGQGVVYTWNYDNSAYETSNCEECGGEGCHNYDSEIDLFIDDNLCDQPVIRKRKAGRFNPRLGQRGDLVINISWVDQLPPIGESVN